MEKRPPVNKLLCEGCRNDVPCKDCLIFQNEQKKTINSALQKIDDERKLTKK